MYKKIIDERLGETNYEINEFGVVRNIETGKEISQQEHNGYKVVCLSKDGIDIKRKVNRLVAIAFLDKNDFKCMPGEKREEIDLESLEVNHKNLNKSNNKLDNLEWCDNKYNLNYGIRNEKVSKNQSKYKIIQKDKNGNLLKVWGNIWDLRKYTTYNHHNIRKCCQGKYKYAYGYIWEYVEL